MSSETGDSARRGAGLALTLTLGAGLVNYVDRITLSFAAPSIAAEFHLKPGATGVLLSAFLWAYAAAQGPAGALTDRLGPRRLLSAALVVWSAAQAATGLATSLPQMIAARLALGLGEAPQWPVGARVVRAWFEPGRRGLATGVFNSASTLGPALAPPIVTGLMLAFGWRGAFVATGAAGAAAALAWWALYRDPATSSEPPASGPVRPAANVLASPTLWAMAAGNFGSGYLTWFYAAWLPSYLEGARHLSVAQTGWAASIPYLCGFAGSLAGGWACDALQRRGVSAIASRKAPLVAGLVGGGAFTALAVAAPDARLALAEISAALMFANIATASIWALAVVAAPPSATATVGAVQNTGGLIGGALAPIATGYLLQTTGSYTPALGLAAAAALVGALTYLVGVRRPLQLDA